MTLKKREILQKLVVDSKGLLSPVDFLASICQRDNVSAHDLISCGFVEEVPQQVNDRTYMFYRATEKGRAVFYPVHMKVWYWFKGDVRTIIVALITAVLTTFIINKLF